MLHVVVNWAEDRRIATADDVEALCKHVERLPAFVVHVTGASGEHGGTLDVIVESDRALVDYLDMDQGIKLASRNPSCTERDIVSLRNDWFPELELDQIEVEQRDLISREKAIAILRHYLTTGETIDLVAWPRDDWGDRPPGEPDPYHPEDEIPF